MNKKTKRVGNANLYIGLAYHKRKSYPRDSHGFEPLDEYFNNDVERDTTSPETDVEELIRQERAKKKATEKEKEVAKKKAQEEEEEKAKGGALQQQDATRVQLTYPAPVQRPYIILDSSDSDSDGAEHLELFRKLAGLATARNNKAPPTSHVPVATAVPVMASAPSLAGTILAAQGGAKTSVEGSERESDKHSSERSHQSQPDGPRVVISRAEGRELRRSQEPPSIRQRKSVGTRAVAEERSNPEPEQGRPKGRPPRRAPGDESDEGNKQDCESSHRSQREEANEDAAGAVSEAATIDVSKEIASKRLRVRKSLVGVGEEESNPEPEQGKRRGRPPKKAVESAPDEVDKHNAERSQWEETNGDAAGTLSEGTALEDSHEVANKWLRPKKSLVDVGEEQNPELEQVRSRGRPPRTAPGDESDEGNKRNLESSHRSRHEETNGDAAGTLFEGTALEDSHEVANKWLRPKKSLVDVGEEQNPELEQVRSRGRPPRKAPGDESDEGNKRNLESSHRSRHEETNGDAAGTLSEGTELEGSHEVANKRLRVRKSLVGVGEEESNPDPEQGKRRGRPPKKAVESAPDEVDKHNPERSQWEETDGDAAGTLSEGTALEDSHEVANKWLRQKKSLVDVGEEQNPEGRPRGRPPRKAPGDEPVEGNKRNLESSHRSRHEETDGDAVGTLSEGTASHEVANERLRPKRSLVDVVEEQNPELEQVRSRGRPSRKVPGVESDEGNKRNSESSHRSRHEETNGDAAGTLSEGTALEDSHEVANKRLRPKKSLVDVGEEQNPEPEQGRPRGRPPRKAPGDEPVEGNKRNLESSHRSRHEETNGDAAGTLSEGTASHEVANKQLRPKRSLVDVVEEQNPELEQVRSRGRPSRKVPGDESDEGNKRNMESSHRSRHEETNGDAAGTLSEGTASHEVANKRLRPKKSLVDVGEEQNPELEQGRTRGRPPRKAPGDEPVEGNKRNLESSHRSRHEETNGDAAGTLSEGTALEDSHEVAKKRLRPKRSLVDVVEEQNPELEQVRSRGRPSRKVPGDESDEGNKRNMESSHRSRHEETNGDAAGTLSEGTASHEVANKRLRPKKSLVDVGEEQNPELEQGRTRGRPPRKAPGDESDEGNKRNSESSHRSQQKEVKGANETVSQGRASIPSAVVDDESREYTAMSSRTYTLPLKPSSSSPKKSNKKQSESSEVNRKNVSQHQETLEKRQTRRSAPSDMSFVPQDTSTLERRLRSMAKEREEEEEDELEEENVMDTQEEEDQSEAEDVQGNMALEEGQGNELGDSDEGASGNEQEGTIVRRLFRSPRESSKSLEKSRKLSELPSGSEHSGTKDSAPTKAPSAPLSARKRKKRWSVVPPALKRTKKAIPSALERLKKAAGVEVDNTVLLNVTDIGGKKYHRVPIKPKEDFTPAVRRSHRTRLPRLEPDEIVDYDQWFNPITLTGPSVVSVLVPAERTPKPRRKNATSNQEVTDDDYPPVPIHDDAGNVVDEQSIIFTPASAEKVNSVGQPVEESPDGVRITKYFAGDNTSNGLITLDGLAEKSKSKASRYDLFFCVMKGKVLVTVNSVQYTLLRHFGIRIPQGALYSVQNLSPSVAELYYYISKVVPINTTESVSE